MKHIVKPMSIILSVLMLISVIAIAPITASAMGGNGSNDVVFNPGIAKSDRGCWFAWTWADNVSAYWARGLVNDDGTITFYGLEDKVVFALLQDDYEDMNMSSWDYAAIYQSDNLDVKGVAFEVTKWTNYNEEWEANNFNGVWTKQAATDSAVATEPKTTEAETTAPAAEPEYTEPQETTEYVEPETVTEAPVEETTEEQPAEEEYEPEVEEPEEEEPVEEVEEKEPNSLEFRASTKSVKAYKLKKSAVTLKPLSIEDYDGKLTITKVKKGTTSYIYNKITVNKSSGSIKIKKGTTKVGTYKIKLKLHATGDADFKPVTTYETVTIKILGKSKNTLSVEIKGMGYKDFKTGALKKGKKSFNLITIKKGKGAVKVTKVKKGTSKGIFKKVKVSKSGKITLKKGKYKKGVYKIKLKVYAKGNKDYKSKSITKTVTVRIAKKFKNCPQCKGKGHTTCTNCGGSGSVYARFTITLFSYGMPYRTYRPRFTCSTCGGDGKMECSKCYHTGKVV